MNESTPPPVEEPQGYQSTPGYVKSRPENNQHYLDQLKDDPWYPILLNTDEGLEELMPGYNINQIKSKFGGLRYYINAPEGTPLETMTKAWAVIRRAEDWVDGFEYARRTAKS
jgi:hypothetical protein